MSKSFAEVSRSPKKSKEGSINQSSTQIQGQPSPIQTSTPTTPGVQFNQAMSVDPRLQTFHPGFQPQYVLNAPLTLSSEDIQRIADAVREGIRESFREEVSQMIDEKLAPVHQEMEQLRADNNDLRRQLDELEQYGRRPLIRFSGIPESTGENTNSKLLDVTKSAGIRIVPDDIIHSHRVGDPKRERRGPRQIIARLRSVDTKFHILRNSKKFLEHENTKHISVNEDLTKLRDRLLFMCRQLCREKKLKNARTSNGKITVKDNRDKIHVIRDASDLAKFGLS